MIIDCNILSPIPSKIFKSDTKIICVDNVTCIDARGRSSQYCGRAVFMSFCLINDRRRVGVCGSPRCRDMDVVWS